MDHIESSTKVYFSNDYGQFKFMSGNRDISERRIEKILKVIKDEGIDVLKYCPVLVDPEMQIIDGQHRYYVSMKLKRPVFYCIIDDIGLNGVAKINSNSQNWKVNDYLNSYVDLKKNAYLRIVEIQEKHKCNTIVLATLLHTGKSTIPGSSNLRELFNDGLIQLNFFDETVALMNKLSDLKPFVKNPYSRRMCEAMQKLLEGGKYDHKVMINKFEQSGLTIEEYTTYKDIIQQMEQIINHRARKRIIIY